MHPPPKKEKNPPHIMVATCWGGGSLDSGGKSSYLIGTTYCSFSSRLQSCRALVFQPTPQCGADVLLLKKMNI